MPAAMADFKLFGTQRWYVAHTQPHREARAAAHLERQGFRAFLPVRDRTVRHARQLRTLSAPIFPRYLFVILDLDRDRWRSVNGTSGVASLVMGRARPLAVPDGVVETLIDSTDAAGVVRFEHDLRPGQKVRLVAGPFAEALGVLSRLDAAGRVEVLLQVLNGEIRMSLRRDWVESAA